jgi:hypothetical protein
VPTVERRLIALLPVQLAPNRLIGDIETTLGKEFLDVSVAQAEAKIQPSSVPNDLRRELVTGIGDGLQSLPYPKRPGSMTEPRPGNGLRYRATLFSRLRIQKTQRQHSSMRSTLELGRKGQVVPEQSIVGLAHAVAVH